MDKLVRFPSDFRPIPIHSGIVYEYSPGFWVKIPYKSVDKPTKL
jgi:hypothetical protein